MEQHDLDALPPYVKQLNKLLLQDVMDYMAVLEGPKSIQRQLYELSEQYYELAASDETGEAAEKYETKRRQLEPKLERNPHLSGGRLNYLSMYRICTSQLLVRHAISHIWNEGTAKTRKELLTQALRYLNNEKNKQEIARLQANFNKKYDIQHSCTRQAIEKHAREIVIDFIEENDDVDLDNLSL